MTDADAEPRPDAGQGPNGKTHAYPDTRTESDTEPDMASDT